MNAPDDGARPAEQKLKRSIFSDSIIVAAVITVVGGFFATFINWQSHSEEQKLKYIQLGIGILRADPKDENAAKIRDWAFRVVSSYSPVKFTKEEEEQILHKQIKAVSAYDSTYTPSFDRDFSSDFTTTSKRPSVKDKPSQN
ncbi:MAG: hypothetical protein ABSC72_05515 [Methylovirgula sp.]|jgi:hypothetical protein